jgi:hypothetical protein
MFSKSVLLGTLVGFLLLFLLGWLFYDIIAGSFYESHTITNVMKDPPNMGLIVLSCVIQAFVLSALYSKVAKGVHSAKGGFEFGAWIGVFLGFGVGLMWYATTNLMDLTGNIADYIWSIVYYGIAGLGIALVFKKFDKQPQ